MEFKSVSKNCVKEWYILRSILFLMLIASFVGFCFIPTSENYQIILKNVLLILWAIFTLLIAVYAFVFPVMQYKRLKYKIDISRIEKHSGVVFLRKAYVPFVRIQHTEVFRGIFDRIFKMATVIIYTAGSVVRICNLDIEQADDIIVHIRKLMTVQAEGDDAND